MNLKENLLKVLSGENVDVTPVISVTQIGIVEAMKKTDAYWPEAHTDPEKMATLGSSLYELAGLECARIPFCLTVEAEAMGCKVDLGTQEKTPLVMESPFESAGDIEIPSDFLKKGRIPAVLEAVKILKEKYGDNLPVIVGITGPFTLTGHLLGVEKLVRYMRLRPGDIELAVDKVLEVSIEYANALSEVGPDIICVADPTSATELINPLQFKTLVKPRLEDLSAEIDTKRVLHICGSAGPILKDMASAGYDGLSLEEKVDIKMVKEELNGGRKIMRVGGRTMSMGGAGKAPKLIGNISSSQTLFRTSPDEVKEKVSSALEAGVDILAPSCGLAPRSPLENIKAMIQGRNEYYGI